MKETLRFDEAQDPTEKAPTNPAPRKTEPQGGSSSRGCLSDSRMRVLYDERNKIKILLRLKWRCAIIKAAEPLDGGERSFWDAELC